MSLLFVGLFGLRPSKLHCGFKSRVAQYFKSKVFTPKNQVEQLFSKGLKHPHF